MTNATLGRDMRKVSNTEVATWLTCQYKYYLEFDLNLEPKEHAGALNRGIVLHDVLAAYYQTLKDQQDAGTPRDHSAAVFKARQVLMGYMSKPGYQLETVTEVDILLQGYWANYQGDPDWIIVDVEKQYELSIVEGSYSFTMRLDLYVQEISTGQFALVDHKTAYDFWTSDDLDLNPQFPKYIAAMRANGIRVDKAILNQIRTRKLKTPSSTDLFRRTVCMPRTQKLRNAMREQVEASSQIIMHRMLPVEAQESKALRVLNKQVCKWCSVKPLCMSAYDGGDISTAIEADYQQRTYGYNNAESDAL